MSGAPRITIDLALARRLERLVTIELESLAESAHALYPASRVETARIGEGVALFGAEEIVFSQASGFGLHGAVPDDEIDALSSFFRERASWAEVVVPSMAHESLAIGLAARGWVPSGFEDTLVMELGSDADARPFAPSASRVRERPAEVRVVASHERSRWGELVAEGFSGDGQPGETEVRMGQCVALRQGATLFWAWVDGAPVATGELAIQDGVGWLSADATLPAYRGRGLQHALQVARLEAAREAGCEIAVSEAVPGGTSHRNMQRLGFRVAYTRLMMACRWESA